MSKQLKEEWKKGFIENHCEDEEDGLRVYEAGDIDGIVDFFYSLHLEEIKKIREMVEVWDKHVSGDRLAKMILDDPLLTIAE